MSEGPGGATAVDLWLVAGLDLTEEPLDGWSADLTPDERAVAARYRIVADQRRSVIGRALARRALAARLGIPAATLRIEIDPRGRPIAPETGLQFSVSHTHGLVGVAVAECAVGFDVEYLARKTDTDLIARRWFHPDEVAAIRAEPGPQRFFTHWTLKEAYCKALGLGLSIDLRALRFEPGERVNLIAEGATLTGWTFETMQIDEEHLAAIAAEARPIHVRVRR